MLHFGCILRHYANLTNVAFRNFFWFHRTNPSIREHGKFYEYRKFGEFRNRKFAIIKRRHVLQHISRRDIITMVSRTIDDQVAPPDECNVTNRHVSEIREN
jgi:hypothetical protein